MEKYEGYAYSIKTTRVKEEDFPYNGQKLNDTYTLVKFLHSLQNEDNEKFIGLYLDTQNQLISIHVVMGIVNQAVVYPRAIIRHALLVNASAIILAHNHPSGHIHPSEADIRLTEQIREASKILDLLVHEHIIIAGNTGKFFSFREEGMIMS